MKANQEQAVTRREQQKEARRREILEAGFRAFTTQGFTATRLEDVAMIAGVGKGTIYLYFDSKEALFEEVVRVNLFPTRDEAAQRVADFEGPASELLATHLHYIYSRLSDGQIPSLIAMVIGEANRFPQLTDFLFRELVSRTRQNMCRIIERGVASGEFRETDIDKYTQILVAPVLISALWKLQFEKLDPIDIRDFASAHIDLVLHGLKR